MIYKPVITSIASKDIRDNAQWYNIKQKGLGKRFTKTIRNKIKFACTNPYMYAVRYKDIRAISLQKFPFLILYYIKKTYKEIVVIAVFNTNKDPNVWKNPL